MFIHIGCRPLLPGVLRLVFPVKNKAAKDQQDFQPATPGSFPSVHREIGLSAAPDRGAIKHIPLSPNSKANRQLSGSSKEKNMSAEAPATAFTQVSLVEASKSTNEPERSNLQTTNRDGISNQVPSHHAGGNATTNEQHALPPISDEGDVARLGMIGSLRPVRGTLTWRRKNHARSRTCIRDLFETRHDIKKTPHSQLNTPVSRLLSIFRPDRETVKTNKWAELEIYNNRWDKLLRVNPTCKCNTLRFTDIPWPILPRRALTCSSPFTITRDNVAEYLFMFPQLNQKDSLLGKISIEIERWDDFELMTSVLRKVRKQDKMKVAGAWSRVVLVLMEMRGECLAQMNDNYSV